MFRSSRLVLLLVLTTLLWYPAEVQSLLPSRGFIRRPALCIAGPLYHAPEAHEESSISEAASDEILAATKLQFKALLEEAMAIKDPGHLPRLLANNIGVVVSLKGKGGAKIIEDIVQEAKEQGQEQMDRTVTTVEAILAFTEDFVEEASQLDRQNKELMGRIIRTMTSNDDSDRDKEELLDQLMEEEKENFTPGFLRHLEGECDRISGQAKLTSESHRLLEIVRVIQARVLEEIGKDMGEATLVLGQLMGYDDENELLGVLDAGLAVRGTEFALEMNDLTKEALDGFQRIPGGVDPGLIQRVQCIDSRLNEFLGDNRSFQ